MAQPSYSQYRTLKTNVNGLVPETLNERMLTCLAALCSQQNPDGSSFVHP